MVIHFSHQGSISLFWIVIASDKGLSQSFKHQKSSEAQASICLFNPSCSANWVLCHALVQIMATQVHEQITQLVDRPVTAENYNHPH
jgi:hypothetical protein